MLDKLPIPEWLLANPLFRGGAGLIFLVLGAYVADVAARRYLVRWLERIAGRSKQHWDDALADHRVFQRAAHFAPLVVIAFGVPLIPALAPELAAVIKRAATAAMAIVAVVAFNNFLAAGNSMYNRRVEASNRPIKGYIQLLQLIASLLAAVVAVALLIDRSPVGLLSGIGALTAVLMLVFRDTLLSFVASVQLTQLDLVRIGDWITASHLNADGDVTDLALHTVKVQNFDKTVTSVPTYRLISEGFVNWRGMKEAGMRRIKRPLLIDTATIRHLSDDDIEGLRRWSLLADYLEAKLADIERFNAEAKRDDRRVPHRRRLTNLGTFRAYVDAYLRRHPGITTDATLMVRLLEPNAQGQPCEIYCFTKTTVWAEYEAIQSDIFDHLYAVLNDFGLRAFQAPAGSDIRALERGGDSA